MICDGMARPLAHKLAGLALFLLLLPSAVIGQERDIEAGAADVTVTGGFLLDSLKIGEKTPYYLAARYPAGLTVLFPDSTYDFAPFEYQSRTYFPTTTDGGISVDSAVYYLTTFEIDRVQRLQLPAYVVIAGDSTAVETPSDSMLITQFVAQVPDTIPVDELPLRMNTTYEKVTYALNVWMIAIVVGLLIFAAVMVWALFGKRIQQYFQARRLRKNHASFLERYDALMRQVQTTFSSPAAESALFTWKKYMEQLENRPYTKLTTRETLRMINEPTLSAHLRHIDRAIYGHDTTATESLEGLKVFADQQYHRKLKEVQHG